MARSFRDRFYTPKVARAIMSPLGIVLFGAATAGAVLVGAPLVLAAGVGVLAWGGNVARSVPRDPKPYSADTGKLAEPWSTYVAEARHARTRFDEVIGSMTAGPLQARLTELAARIEDAVAETNRIATRGNALADALSRIDTATPAAELAQIKATHQGRAMSPTTSETMRSLQAQVDAGERIASAAEQAAERLRMLDARYDELVARAVEVSLGTGDSEGLSHDVDDLVTELEALRRALDETDRAAGATGLATG
jgi:hypothetical protein